MAVPTTVHDLVDEAAARWPDATYASSTESDARLTFGELAQSCREVRGWLRTLGAQPGDAVSLVMPNGLQTVRLLLGAMHAGLVVNPVNLLAQPSQMQYVLAHSDCRVVFVAPEWEDRVRALLPALGRTVVLVVVDPDGDGLPTSPADS
jgi:acyl-CoA synthetase (AMP-forming)/AMP-acid ligase II